MSHLSCNNNVQAPKPKSRACKHWWEVWRVRKGVGLGRYLDEVGWIWNCGHFCRDLWCCGGKACGNGGLGVTLSLGPPLLRGWVNLSTLPCCDRSTDPPRAVGSASALPPCYESFKGELLDVNGLAVGWESQLFCTNKLADRSTTTSPSKLIDKRRVVVLSLPLGFNNLFHNKSLPLRALWPTFHILLATRMCSFSLEICYAFKSMDKFIFTIEKHEKK